MFNVNGERNGKNFVTESSMPSLEEYVDEINSVTLEEAKEVAKKYFNKKNLCFVRLN